MRLNNKEISIIKSETFRLFEESLIYLFGSRIDDHKKGGDIDLYIIPKNQENVFRKKLLLKARLEDFIFKPIDIVVATDKNRRIEKEAIKGILL